MFSLYFYYYKFVFFFWFGGELKHEYVLHKAQVNSHLYKQTTDISNSKVSADERKSLGGCLCLNVNYFSYQWHGQECVRPTTPDTLGGE